MIKKSQGYHIKGGKKDYKDKQNSYINMNLFFKEGYEQRMKIFMDNIIKELNQKFTHRK